LKNLFGGRIHPLPAFGTYAKGEVGATPEGKLSLPGEVYNDAGGERTPSV
jgi:hypothetical protein